MVKLGASLVFVAALILIFGGMSGTFAWAGYRRIATQEAVVRTAHQLASSPPTGLRRLSRVEITPGDSTEINIHGDPWTLFAIDETPGVVFLTQGTLQRRPQQVLVDRDSDILIPACRFRIEHMSASTQQYRLHDPRPQAAREARLAGWTAVISWPLGTLLMGIGLPVMRRGLRQQAAEAALAG